MYLGVLLKGGPEVNLDVTGLTGEGTPTDRLLYLGFASTGTTLHGDHFYKKYLTI